MEAHLARPVFCTVITFALLNSAWGAGYRTRNFTVSAPSKALAKRNWGCGRRMASNPVDGMDWKRNATLVKTLSDSRQGGSSPWRGWGNKFYL